jgi:hypothetical protein
MEVEFGKASVELYCREGMSLGTKSHNQNGPAYKSIHGLICSLARFKTIIDFVLPWTHLNDTDKIGVDNGLLVEVRQQSVKMISNEMRFSTSSRVES